MSQQKADEILDSARSSVTSRRRFVQGALAMGLSASTANAILAGAQTPQASPEGSPVASPGASPVAGAIDPLVLGEDQVNGTFPLTEQPITFRVLVPSSNDVGSFEDNEFTRWYQEKTNVQIEWQVVPGDEAQTGLNVRLASGDYPDILMSFNPPPAVQQLYGSQGVFLPLNEYIEQDSVEFKRVVEQYPLALTAVMAADGNVYSLPYVNDCFHCAQDQKLWIYEPWLQAAGLGMPQTTEEYHTALKAFKDQDVSGQGNTFPLSSCVDSWNNELDLFFMNSFVFNPGEPYLSVQDGTVTAAYATDGWKEGIAYLAKLFAEGLIDPEAFTQTAEQLQAKTGGDAGTLVGSAPGGSWGVFVNWNPEDPSLGWADYKLVPALEGPQGVRISAFDPYLPYASGNFIITDKCPDPRLAFRWADGLYDLETTLRSVQGVLGEQWRWAEPGELGYDGQQAIWGGIPNPPSDGPRSFGWIQTGPSFRSSRVRFGEIVSNPDLLPTNLDVITLETLGPYRQPAEWALPPMFFTEEQVQVVAETETTIVPFVKETFARFITGQGNVDDEWENYLSQLEAMGLQPYLEAYQATYDAQRQAG